MSSDHADWNDARALAPGQDPQSRSPIRLLLAVIAILSKRRALIAAAALAGFVLSSVYVALKPSKYEAEARIEVAPAGSNSLGLDELVSKAFNSSDNAVQLQTAVQVLRSNTIANDVMAKLRLPQRQDFAGRWTQPPGRDFASIPPKDRDHLLERFHKTFTAEVVPKTDLIALHFRARDPRLAADAANLLVQCYRQRNFRSSYDSASEVSSWLAKQTEGLRDRARDAQERLAALDRSVGLIGADETDNLVLKRLEQLSEQLTAAEADRIVKEARYRLAESQNPELISTLAPNATLQLLRAQQAEMRTQYSQMNAKYGKGYPKLAELSTQMARLDESIDGELKGLQQRYRNELQTAERSEQMLRTSVEEQKQKAFELNQGAAQRSILKRELESAQQLYETLDLKLQQAGVAAGLASANVAIVDIAQVPSEPVEPKPLFDISLGTCCGIGLGLVLSLALEAARDAVTSAEEAESVALAPVLATVPLMQAPQPRLVGKIMGRKMGSIARTSVVTLDRPLSASAESYRTLRSCLLLRSGCAAGRVIVVTSPMPLDGKTLTAVNCAIVLAQHGLKVLLLDADLRKPAVHTTFEIPREPGLAALLHGGNEDSSAMVRPSSISNLRVVPAGTSSGAAGELLSSQRMTEVLNAWRSQFDYIVIDTPPVTITSDAVVLGAQADSVLVVVRSEFTTRQSLRWTRDMLTRNGAPFTGMILNAVHPRNNGEPYFAFPFFHSSAVNSYYETNA